MKGLVYRVVGPPPSKDAPRSERLRWIRRLNVRWSTPAAALALILLVVWVVPWWIAVIGVAWQGYTIASISHKIRREERRESASG